jgi:membrane-associated phospholipid phosphatase
VHLFASNLRFGQISLLLALGVLIDTVVLARHPPSGVVTGVCAAIRTVAVSAELCERYPMLVGLFDKEAGHDQDGQQ